MKRVVLCLLVMGSMAGGLLPGTAKRDSSQRLNVLFICIDDLRPDLACYGNAVVRSPNLDALARQSALFTRHYVTQPTCGASRCSMLTGKLPRHPVELTNEAIEKQLSDKPRTDVPETFIDNLRRNGYYTVGIGKISHSADGYLYQYEEPRSNRLELPYSWDEVRFDPGRWKTGWNAFFAYADGSNRQSRNAQVKPYERAEVDDEGYPDGLSAKLAVAKLNELAARKQPFFLGVGFFKPHLPFNAPRKYWDMYDEAGISLTPSPNLPEKVNAASLHGSGEFNGYKLGDEQATLEKPVSDAYARKLRHAYYAGVSYVDAQVGKVLAELKRLGLDQNTVVVVWGDHGWHLGDHRVWGKHTIFERAVRSVCLVRTPAMQNGVVRDQIISSIDMYPTLMEACGVSVPPGVEGRSFAQLLTSEPVPDWNRVAYSYFRRGISVRTDRYRLTKYFRDQQPSIELYDHQTDPNENHNVASDFPEVVRQLTPVWQKGNTGLFE